MVGNKPSSREEGPVPIEFTGTTNDTCLTACVPIWISSGGRTANDCSAPFATRFRIEALHRGFASNECVGCVKQRRIAAGV